MEDKVLETVINDIKFVFEKDVLVKPLEPIMVTKEVTIPIPTGEIGKDGFEIYDTKAETKEIESEYAKGIILAMPANMDHVGIKYSFSLGDTVVYSNKFAKDFDLYKTSKLIKPYDVIAICK